jgi:hypothetical protein
VSTGKALSPRNAVNFFSIIWGTRGIYALAIGLCRLRGLVSRSRCEDENAKTLTQKL